ncbi:MAG: efflux RND transporter periplasmic adaptor subunit [Cyanobacteria bacterium J06600_6]
MSVKLIGLCLNLLAIVFILFASWGRNFAQKEQNDLEAQETSQVKILPVETVIVQPVDSYLSQRNYTGRIVAGRRSALSFEINGKLTKIKVDQGDLVESNTPLAFLGNRSLKIKQRELLARRKQMVARLKEMQAGSTAETIAAARASVRQREQQLKLARQKSDRRASLYSERVISQEQRDEASNEAITLQAQLDNSQSQLDKLLAGTRPERIEAQRALIEEQDANLDNLAIELEKSILKAPFSGTISKRLVDEGTVVEAGQEVLQLVDTERLEAQIGIPVDVASTVKKGDRLNLQIQQQSYPAKVAAIVPELDSQTLTSTAILTLEKSAAVIPGQLARLQLTSKIEGSGYWLPITALVETEQGLWSCYVLSAPENIADQKQEVFRIDQNNVEILHSEGDRILVRGTLQPQQQVIVDGIHRLVPGQLVRVSKQNIQN